MNLFFQPKVSDGHHYLEPDESKHCIRVLRKKEGDLISVIDGKGNTYKCLITDVQPRQVFFKIQNQFNFKPRDYHIHIAIAPTKSHDRIEWFVEKASEIGINEISFIVCDHSERDKINRSRVEKKCIEAIKQSGNPFLPVTHQITTFDLFIKKNWDDNRYIAFRGGPEPLVNCAKKSGRYLLLVGPEGDFSARELKLANEMDFKQVTLSESILRTETAGLVACQTLVIINQG